MGESQKDLYESLIRGIENHIRFIEGCIKFDRNMVKNLKESTLPGNKNEAKAFAAQVKKLEVRLKEARERLTDAEMRYKERFHKPETIQEKALKRGLTLIRGGVL